MVMATLKQKIRAELKVRELLERESVALPDRIEYEDASVRLYWDGPKVGLVVDISEFADGSGGAAPDLDVFPREG
jgi:hypothetical protein